MKKSKFIHDKSNQSIFDAFNKFIFSDDQKIFDKLASKIIFVNKTKDIPGDIVELGVFKGSGLIGWLKSLASFSVKNKNVLGFDIFDENNLIKKINTKDKDLMKKLFSQRNFKIKNYEKILNKILYDSNFNNYEIIKGDVTKTLKKYLNKNIGFRASIVNFDLDIYKPTYECLKLLWPRLVKGGIFVFDEYAIKEWSESDAVDEFLLENNLKLLNTNFISPSAYIIKN